MAPCGLDSHRAGARVASEQVAKVRIDSRFVRQWHLNNEVQPVVSKSRIELLVRYLPLEFDLEACGKSRYTRALRSLMKFPLQA